MAILCLKVRQFMQQSCSARGSAQRNGHEVIKGYTPNPARPWIFWVPVELYDHVVRLFRLDHPFRPSK
jgi:hypothetical protein